LTGGEIDDGLARGKCSGDGGRATSYAFSGRGLRGGGRKSCFLEKKRLPSVYQAVLLLVFDQRLPPMTSAGGH